MFPIRPTPLTGAPLVQKKPARGDGSQFSWHISLTTKPHTIDTNHCAIPFQPERISWELFHLFQSWPSPPTSPPSLAPSSPARWRSGRRRWWGRCRGALWQEDTTWEKWELFKKEFPTPPSSTSRQSCSCSSVLLSHHSVCRGRGQEGAVHLHQVKQVN